MNHSAETEDAAPAESHKGFIAFCETNLRYETGPKAWIILGPYLVGAFVFEGIINTSESTFTAKLTLWTSFLAYLILFPEIWRRILKSCSPRKTGDKPASSLIRE